MAKKIKGHSRKKRHHTGVPAQGIASTKEGKPAQSGRAAKRPPPKCCGKPMQHVRLVAPGGTARTALRCRVCKVLNTGGGE